LETLEETYTEFLQQQASIFENVLVLLLEPWILQPIHTTQEVVNQAQSVCDRFDNVYLLDRACLTLSPQTVVIGCTLLSDIADLIALRIKNFKKMRSTRDDDGRRRLLTAAQYREWHRRDVAFFRRAKSSSQSAEQRDACTHEPGPLHARNEKYEISLLTSAFTTDFCFRHQSLPFVAGMLSPHVMLC
jgi:hypothetical protein